jgi:hypothetical protein
MLADQEQPSAKKPLPPVPPRRNRSATKFNTPPELVPPEQPLSPPPVRPPLPPRPIEEQFENIHLEDEAEEEAEENAEIQESRPPTPPAQRTSADEALFPKPQAQQPLHIPDNFGPASPNYVSTNPPPPKEKKAICPNCGTMVAYRFGKNKSSFSLFLLLEREPLVVLKYFSFFPLFFVIDEKRQFFFLFVKTFSDGGHESAMLSMSCNNNIHRVGIQQIQEELQSWNERSVQIDERKGHHLLAGYKRESMEPPPSPNKKRKRKRVHLFLFALLR